MDSWFGARLYSADGRLLGCFDSYPAALAVRDSLVVAELARRRTWFEVTHLIAETTPNGVSVSPVTTFVGPPGPGQLTDADLAEVAAWLAAAHSHPPAH